MTYRYDVFFSYARRDNRPASPSDIGWITAFHTALAQIHRENGRPGETIYIDTSEIAGGDDWERNIREGLRDSCLMLAFASPNYFASEWCLKEWEMYVEHESARSVGLQGILPVNFVEMAHPMGAAPIDSGALNTKQWAEDIRRRQHIDFRSLHGRGVEAFRSAAARAQLEALQERISSVCASMHGPVESPGTTADHNPLFTGRRDERRKLSHLLAGAGFGVVTAVQGLPGIGKTALVNEYAHEHAARYMGGRWLLPCEGVRNLPAAVFPLAEEFGIELADNEKRDVALAAKRIFLELENRTCSVAKGRCCLLIFDNVDRQELLTAQETNRIPKAPWLHVLVTTRLGLSELSQIPAQQVLTLDELAESDALALIEKLQPDRRFRSDSERAAALRIVRALGAFTLEVEAVAIYLGIYPDVTCSAFAARLESEGIHAPESAAEDPDVAARMAHREKRLSAVFEPMLASVSAEERFVLECAALLHPDYVPLPWLRDWAEGKFPDSFKSRPGYPAPWAKLARRLLGRRLLTETADRDENGEPRTVRMHRSIQETIRRRPNFDEDELRKSVKYWVFHRCTSLSRGRIGVGRRWEIEPVKAVAEGLLESDPFMAGRMGDWLRIVYVEIGNYQDALIWTRRTFDADAREGVENPFLYANHEAQIHFLRGAYDEAESLLNGTIGLCRDSGQPPPAEILRSFGIIARIRHAQGKHKEGEKLERWVRESEQALAGPKAAANPTDETDKSLAQQIDDLLHGRETTNRMGGVDKAESLERHGQHKAAEDLLRQALELQERISPEAPETLTVLNNLGVFLLRRGRFEEAEPLLQRVVAVQLREDGLRHPGTLGSMANLAGCYMNLDLDKADALFREILEPCRELLGTQHEVTKSIIHNLRNLRIWRRMRPVVYWGWVAVRWIMILGAVWLLRNLYAWIRH